MSCLWTWAATTSARSAFMLTAAAGVLRAPSRCCKALHPCQLCWSWQFYLCMPCHGLLLVLLMICGMFVRLPTERLWPQVSEAGSVVVEKLMEVERYSHVMHISSTVTGRLLPELDAWDALRAALPAGTVSGAPKVRRCCSLSTVWYIFVVLGMPQISMTNFS